jgi:hypothetical protein
MKKDTSKLNEFKQGAAGGCPQSLQQLQHHTVATATTAPHSRYSNYSTTQSLQQLQHHTIATATTAPHSRYSNYSITQSLQQLQHHPFVTFNKRLAKARTDFRHFLNLKFRRCSKFVMVVSKHCFVRNLLWAQQQAGGP